MEKIVIIGGGGHAKAAVGILNKVARFDLLGYLDMKDKGEIMGAKYLGTDEELPSLKTRYPSCNAVIGVGGLRFRTLRRTIQTQLQKLGFELPTIISPTAIVNEDVHIGKGTLVFDRATINSGTTIGECTIINTGCIIDHDCNIGDFVHIAPGVTLSGGVTVGCDCIIGVGSTVIQFVRICDHCDIGAGATVVENCEVPGLYLGTPAKRREQLLTLS